MSAFTGLTVGWVRQRGNQGIATHVTIANIEKVQVKIGAHGRSSSFRVSGGTNVQAKISRMNRY